MNVLNRIIIKKMDMSIKLGIAYKDNPILFRDFKKSLNKLYGIFFINYIKTKDSNIYTVMIKRKEFTYIYSYNLSTDELILKGERKNVNT